jgi:hypothetical protein
VVPFASPMARISPSMVAARQPFRDDGYDVPSRASHEKALYMKFTPKRSEATLFELFPLKWEGDAQTDGAPWYASAFPDMPLRRHF